MNESVIQQTLGSSAEEFTCECTVRVTKGSPVVTEVLLRDGENIERSVCFACSLRRFFPKPAEIDAT